MTDPTDPALSFEQALAELEQIVTELERGETPLEETIARFERGVALARRCEDRLNEADRKVAVLLQEGSRVVEKDLATGERLASRPDPAASAAPSRFEPPAERFEAAPERFDPPPERPAAPERFDPPPERFEPAVERPEPAERTAPPPPRPAPPRPAAAPRRAPEGQMSLGSAFAVKPAHEMDDDDIPF